MVCGGNPERRVGRRQHSDTLSERDPCDEEERNQQCDRFAAPASEDQEPERDRNQAKNKTEADPEGRVRI